MAQRQAPQILDNESNNSEEFLDFQSQVESDNRVDSDQNSQGTQIQKINVQPGTKQSVKDKQSLWQSSADPYKQKSQSDYSLFTKIRKVKFDFRDVDRKIRRPLEFRLFYWMDLLELLILTILFWSAAIKLDYFKKIKDSQNSEN